MRPPTAPDRLGKKLKVRFGLPTPLVASDGRRLSLANWSGIESHDLVARQATVRTGSVLHDLGEPLLDLGLAMANLGDIDVQALGGALGTGTHGTGTRPSHGKAREGYGRDAFP